MVGKTRSLLITLLNMPSLLSFLLWGSPLISASWGGKNTHPCTYLYSAMASELWTKGSITKGWAQMDELMEKSPSNHSILWTPSGQTSHPWSSECHSIPTPGWMAMSLWNRQALVQRSDPAWSLGLPHSLWLTHRGDAPGAEASEMQGPVSHLV